MVNQRATARRSRCTLCGAENEPGDRFCGDCGAPLGAGGAPGSDGGAPPAAVSERRLVSVLFADLVGFTTLSEHPTRRRSGSCCRRTLTAPGR
ncbi:MAG: zinc-ribbon domain-containing protein [Solirubrobacteraceae bacterium]